MPRKDADPLPNVDPISIRRIDITTSSEVVLAVLVDVIFK